MASFRSKSRWLVLAATIVLAQMGVSAQTLPTRLSDAEFWKLVSDLSEPTGTFPSENFASNESGFQWIIPKLLKRTQPASAYIGVGPEQNFTYIAALHPKIAFIIDIRRQAMLQHLVYKALFEMAADRADFLALMFSRPRPAGLDSAAAPERLFAAYDSVASDSVKFRETLGLVKSRLTLQHGFGLSPEDLETVDHIFQVYFEFGPHLSYSSRESNPSFSLSPLNLGAFGFPARLDSSARVVVMRQNGSVDTIKAGTVIADSSYCYMVIGSSNGAARSCVTRYSNGVTSTSSSGNSGLTLRIGSTLQSSGTFSSPGQLRVDLGYLMAQRDSAGQQRSFLATEANYGTMRDLEQRNMLVPVVGDFAGPQALKGVGKYLKDHGATVSAYYTSNVESYLFQHDVWRQFYANVASLPLDSSSTFIRSGVVLPGANAGTGGMGASTLGSIAALLVAVASGMIQTYRDLALVAFR